jgi:hypothetical protein
VTLCVRSRTAKCSPRDFKIFFHLHENRNHGQYRYRLSRSYFSERCSTPKIRTTNDLLDSIWRYLTTFPLCARILYRSRRYVTAQRYYISTSHIHGDSSRPRVESRESRLCYDSTNALRLLLLLLFLYHCVVLTLALLEPFLVLYYHILPRSDTSAIYIIVSPFFLYHCTLAPATNSTCKQMEREINVFISRAKSIRVIESYL